MSQSRWRPGSLALALVTLVLVVGSWLAGPVAPAAASLDNDRFDGNIYALYAGNGSLVPPRSTLAQALQDGRVTVLIYYLDDSSVSKRFAAVVSELQRVWGNTIELMPLVTDPLRHDIGSKARQNLAAGDPSRYWSGQIPQVVVLDRNGSLVFDASGQVPIDAIHTALSRATGLPQPPPSAAGPPRSFNELNSEVVSAAR